MKRQSAVLFVLENDYYPRDMRVFNECTSLSNIYSCFVLAPRMRGQRFVERIGSVTCFRFPHFEAQSLRWIFVEYLSAACWFALLIPLISFVKKINVVHVANPPDFIIPLMSWLSLFGVKIVFDIHDLSVETFKGKKASRTPLGRLIVPALRRFESWSIATADLIITTNISIKEHVCQMTRETPIQVVRNSNPVRYRNLVEIQKRPRDAAVNIGYFGLLPHDEAAGLDNFFVLADALARNQVPFRFSIVGDGAGLAYLRNAVAQRNMGGYFSFSGYVDLPEAFDLITSFDFGLLTWGYLPKNHLHTAMKVMDYMCCAVPVCSLKLKEQIASTNSIGIHENTFDAVADRIADIFADTKQYEELRARTLAHFNQVLCWERQRGALLDAYSDMLSGVRAQHPLA